VGLRNRLIHGYDAIDFDILWQILTQDLPPLIAALEKIVPPEEKLWSGLTDLSLTANTRKKASSEEKSPSKDAYYEYLVTLGIVTSDNSIWDN